MRSLSHPVHLLQGILSDRGASHVLVDQLLHGVHDALREIALHFLRPAERCKELHAGHQRHVPGPDEILNIHPLPRIQLCDVHDLRQHIGGELILCLCLSRHRVQLDRVEHIRVRLLQRSQLPPVLPEILFLLRRQKTLDVHCPADADVIVIEVISHHLILLLIERRLKCIADLFLRDLSALPLRLLQKLLHIEEKLLLRTPILFHVILPVASSPILVSCARAHPCQNKWDRRCARECA